MYSNDGPFTSIQKQKDLKSIAINKSLVRGRAIRELKETNVLYHDVPFLEECDIPDPLITDMSKEEDSQDTNLEIVHETMVFFPEMGCSC